MPSKTVQVSQLVESAVNKQHMFAPGSGCERAPRLVDICGQQDGPYLEKVFAAHLVGGIDEDALKRLVEWPDALTTTEERELRRRCAWPAYVIREGSSLVGLLVPPAPKDMYMTTLGWSEPLRMEWLAVDRKGAEAVGIGPYSTTERLRALGDVVQSILFLHTKHVALGDLHQGNVLMSRDARTTLLIDCESMAGPAWGRALPGGKAPEPYMAALGAGVGDASLTSDWLRMSYMTQTLITGRTDEIALNDAVLGVVGQGVFDAMEAALVRHQATELHIFWWQEAASYWIQDAVRATPRTVRGTAQAIEGGSPAEGVTSAHTAQGSNAAQALQATLHERREAGGTRPYGRSRHLRAAAAVLLVVALGSVLSVLPWFDEPSFIRVEGHSRVLTSLAFAHASRTGEPDAAYIAPSGQGFSAVLSAGEPDGPTLLVDDCGLEANWDIVRARLPARGVQRLVLLGGAGAAECVAAAKGSFGDAQVIVPGGLDRVEAAASYARYKHENGYAEAALVEADSLPSALQARLSEYPVLFFEPTAAGLPSATLSELRRAGAGGVLIVATRPLSEAVATELREWETKRFTYQDPVEFGIDVLRNSIEIARREGASLEAYVASTEDLGGFEVPRDGILLFISGCGRAPTDMLDLLAQPEVAKLALVGGQGAVCPAVEGQLRAAFDG